MSRYVIARQPQRTDAKNDSGVAIQVTPEMIEAGLAEMAGFDWAEDAANAGECVKRVWVSMTLASRREGNDK